MHYTIPVSNRRTVLRSLGAVSTLGISGLAGCTDGGDGRGDGDHMDGDGMDGGSMDGGSMDGDGMDGGGRGDGGDSVDGDDGAGDYDDAESIPGTDYPAVDEWLTETEVGGADDTYVGSIVDLREESQVTIDVGAPGNGDGFAFGPSAVAVSTGAEILWEWTGEGGRHNVVAAPDAQIGESDYVFDSGQPVSDADTEYTYTFDESGIALYQCEPHLSLGMKGAIIVE